jgi:DNA-binding NtrC family response regulator
MNATVPASSHGLVGQSPEIASVRRLIEKASRNRLPVLLLGESGTGKEVVARGIHDANPRGRFVPIDCGSLVGALMESELFGHARGAFSGAVEAKKGLVELADGGTAFFDEIGDLPLEMQVKLLRLIQEREFRAVGSLQWRKVDRLNVMAIKLPPLRERKQDLALLVQHFLESASDSGLPRFQPSRELLDTFFAYDWPGNVRELKHCMERMAALNSDSALQMADLPSALQYHHSAGDPEALSTAASLPASGYPLPCVTLAPKSPVISLPESERQAISSALEATQGERSEAARLLGIGRTTLYRKMKEYGLH